MWKLFYMLGGETFNLECENKVGVEWKKIVTWCIKDCYHGKRACLYIHWFVMSIDIASFQWIWRVSLICEMDSNLA
jgi:hypothetical protein